MCPQGYTPADAQPGNSSCVLALEQTNKQNPNLNCKPVVVPQAAGWLVLHGQKYNLTAALFVVKLWREDKLDMTDVHIICVKKH